MEKGCSERLKHGSIGAGTRFGGLKPDRLKMQPATRALLLGRNSVDPASLTERDRTQMLAGPACNTLPGVALSEHARMPFMAD